MWFESQFHNHSPNFPNELYTQRSKNNSITQFCWPHHVIKIPFMILAHQYEGHEINAPLYIDTKDIIYLIFHSLLDGTAYIVLDAHIGFTFDGMFVIWILRFIVLFSWHKADGIIHN